MRSAEFSTSLLIFQLAEHLHQLRRTRSRHHAPLRAGTRMSWLALGRSPGLLTATPANFSQRNGASRVPYRLLTKRPQKPGRRRSGGSSTNICRSVYAWRWAFLAPRIIFLRLSVPVTTRLSTRRTLMKDATIQHTDLVCVP